MPPRKAPEAFRTPQTDAPTWVGKAILAALTANPALSEPLARLVQDMAGPNRALELINALNEAGYSIGSVVKKRELTEEEKEKRRETLKKAREAKKVKQSGT